ncbi:MAG: hypothetical protein WAW41_15790 [Methylobacter sp.]
MASGHFGNKNAEKPDEHKASATVQIRCTESEKQAWQAQAASKGLKLSELARKLFNQACED